MRSARVFSALIRDWTWAKDRCAAGEASPTPLGMTVAATAASATPISGSRRRVIRARTLTREMLATEAALLFFLNRLPGELTGSGGKNRPTTLRQGNGEVSIHPNGDWVPGSRPWCAVSTRR